MDAAGPEEPQTKGGEEAGEGGSDDTLGASSDAQSAQATITEEKLSPSRTAGTIDPHHGSDTTYRKLFIGGLAWQTTTERLRDHFAVYGELVEAVVIADKASGRSKGYGFVTYARDGDAAKALKNASPTIDGRRTNCNLAAFGNVRTRDRSRNNYFDRGGGYGGRGQGGPYYYDQQGMLYGTPGQMEGYGGGMQGYGPPMGGMGMGAFNPYNMGFNPMMMQQQAAQGMMGGGGGFMMAPGYDGAMYGMQGSPHVAPDMPLDASMAHLSLGGPDN